MPNKHYRFRRSLGNVGSTPCGDTATREEEALIISAISESKRKSISVLSLIEASPSLSSNLVTHEQMKAAGWFSTEEL